MRISRRVGERGAALVEFAIVAPLLILLLFGIIEGSWAFAQANDVRHGTREGTRLAAVDYGDAPTLAAEICSRMDLQTSPANVTAQFSNFNGSGVRGDYATVTVTQQYQSLTGILNGVFGNLTISSSVEFRLEQPSSPTSQWWNDSTAYVCS